MLDALDVAWAKLPDGTRYFPQQFEKIQALISAPPAPRPIPDSPTDTERIRVFREVSDADSIRYVAPAPRPTVTMAEIAGWTWTPSDSLAACIAAKLRSIGVEVKEGNDENGI